jgi:purine nucleosidase
MKKVKEFIVMGGTDKFHGNCSPVTEFNFWVDPEAANEVFASNFAKVNMVGLDVTHQIIFSPNLREVANQIGGEKGKFVHDITRFYVDFHWKQERTLGCVINDPLVIAMLLDDSLVQSEDAYIEVETEGIATGQSVCDAGGRFHKGMVNAKVAHEVDVRRFFEILFTRLFPGMEADIELSLNWEFGKGD